MSKKMVFLSKEDLLKKDELQIEEVKLSGNRVVCVREMTGHEKDLWEKSLMKKVRTGDKKNPVEYEVVIDEFRAKLAVMTICDKEGNLLFKPTDVSVLNSAMSAANMDKIVKASQKLNAISEEDKEEILKNSEADQVGSSNSDSVEN